MPTQIAPTPIIYGEEAREIMREAKTPPSEKSIENAKKFREYFDEFMEKDGLL